MNINCVSCNKKQLEKNILGINKKMLGSTVRNFYCMDCLAEYLDATVEDLLEKINEFKEEGCIEFQ